MTTSGWRIVLHGGCADTSPSVGQQHDIEQNLTIIADAAAKALQHGATAKDVVIQIISALEDCQLFNAGRGSALTQEGVHELEAGIVDGHSAAYGAVGCVTATKNPILVANALLEHGPHCMLVGQAADDIAKKLGLETVANDYFTTPFQYTHWQQKVQLRNEDHVCLDLGTVGAVVLDSHGRLAAGASTGGTTGKLKGSVGDTALLGAGLYANSRVGVVCSGAGDQIVQQLVATKVANYYASGLGLTSATCQALSEVSHCGKPCAVAAIDEEGQISLESTARVFYTASASSNSPPQSFLCMTTFPIIPQHTFYNTNRLIAGLSRYPAAPGHTLAMLRQLNIDLFSLKLTDFTGVMLGLKKIAAGLRMFYLVDRCALVTDGGNFLSLLPLHGLSGKWQPVTSYLKEFHENFPGYISSKNGPQMDAIRLDSICSMIQTVSGTREPFKYHFEGDQSDKNLFARIVRGELSQWRVWEDDQHVAFLTPFANTPGFTVVVPRAHLASDIFSLDEAAYSKLIGAARTVGRILKEAFGARRCGMIFEGFEIDYAHVKLIPIHEAAGNPPASPLMLESTYDEKYQGFVTSLSGPLIKDVKSLTSDAFSIRKSREHPAATI